MPIRSAGRDITDIRWQGQLIQRVMHGSTLVWTRNKIFDDFDRPTGTKLEAQGWTIDDHSGFSQGNIIGGTFSYPAVIQNGEARHGLPEGILSLPLVYTRERFTGLPTAAAPGTAQVNAMSTDDGFVEVVVGNPGSGGGGWFGEQPLIGELVTDVLARYPDSPPDTGLLPVANGLTGIGMRLADSKVSIIRRSIEKHLLVEHVEETELMGGGTFQGGDRIRLRFMGRDPVATYSLWVNGDHRGTITDDFPQGYPIGPGFRSMSIKFTAFKELLGPRRFSPAIDRIEMSS